MIPLQDDIPARRYPFVMMGIIVACVVAFLYELSLPHGVLKSFVLHYGVVPRRFTDDTIVASLPEESIPILTSMFLHGGWLHLIGNMWYLWIFGDNIEDRMGHSRFLIFYLAAGIVASMVHVFVNPRLSVPSIGASGAIAGVLGAYLRTFPTARVLTVVPIFFFIQIIRMPALLLLGFWFLMQLFNGAATIAPSAQSAQGVAWWAHIGGFLFGMVVGPLFMRGDKEVSELEPVRRRGGWIRDW